MKKENLMIAVVAATCLVGSAYKAVYAQDSSTIMLAVNEDSTAKNVITDSAITTAIKAKFAADTEINALDIHVETVNKKVTLTGAVTSKEIENRAIDIAKTTNGVRKVVSKLKIEAKVEKK